MGRNNNTESNQTYHDEQQDFRDQENAIMQNQQEEEEEEEEQEVEEATQMCQMPVRPVQFPPQQMHQMPVRPVQFPPQQMCHTSVCPVHPPRAANNIGQAQVIFTNRWKSGLFDCMNDTNNALITLFFPCITFGQNAEIMDQGQITCATSGLFLLILPVIYGSSYRTKLRTKYRLVEEAGPDIMIYLLCAPCAICQEYRELQSNGFDPSIGWLGNMQVQQQKMDMKPPSAQQMQG